VYASADDQAAEIFKAVTEDAAGASGNSEEV